MTGGLIAVRNGSWELWTTRGTVQAEQLVIATNGYAGDCTPDLKRRIVPLASPIIATAELPPDLAADQFPQLRDIRVAHCWTGNVAFILDALLHTGRQPGGMHYLLGCNGSGAAMLTYLGWQTARKIAGITNQTGASERAEIPDRPLYSGNPWFLPTIGGWYRLRDEVDRRLAAFQR